MLWRGALAGCSGGVLWRDALAGKPARRPARGQEEASKRPARGQEEASKRPARRVLLQDDPSLERTM